MGGLSSLAYDRGRRAWASTVDNRTGDPSRIWFFRSLASPQVVGSPLVLRRPDGTPYDGATADHEGLAVLPDGRFLGRRPGRRRRRHRRRGWHRLLVYRSGRGGWTLQKQIAYRTEPGQRIPEVAAVGNSDLLVQEASFDPDTGQRDPALPGPRLPQRARRQPRRRPLHRRRLAGGGQAVAG